MFKLYGLCKWNIYCWVEFPLIKVEHEEADNSSQNLTEEREINEEGASEADSSSLQCSVACCYTHHNRVY